MAEIEYSSWFKNGDFKNHIINEKNIPITEKYINKVFSLYDLKHKVVNLENFQLAMIHISYLNRSNITEKTAKMLKDVVPISNENKLKAMPLIDKKKKQTSDQEEDNGSYGRLEYLGDAVIHLILAQYLFERYKKKDEGFLTKIRTKIEKADTLSILSKKIGLHKYAVVARNIEQSDGRNQNTHLTEDIFEAFIGALSLETSFEDCKKFVIAIIEEEINIPELINTDDNYKDRLMQYFHQQKWGEPKYYEDIAKQQNIKDGCQDIKIFTMFVKKQTGETLGIGVGNTKTKAEQESACNALIALKIITNDDDKSDYYGDDSENSDDYFE